jgi:cytochrome P450
MADHVVTAYDQGDALLKRPDLRQALYDAGAILMERVLVNLHGAEHRSRRTAEARVFRRDFFRYYETEVFPVTLEETLAPYLERGEADICDFGYAVMMNLTADFTGIDRPDRTEEETGALLAILRTLGKAPTLGTTTGDKDAIRAEIEAALRDFDRRFYQPSKARRLDLLARHATGEIGDDDLPRDVLTAIFENPNTAAEPDDVLMKEAAFFLLAGAFTSIHSMTHAVHRILEWFEAHPEQAAALRGDMTFLQRAAWETSRLHPSSPVTRRRPVEAVTIEGLGEIAPEDTITVNLLAANRDEARFGPTAADFDPYRETNGTPLYGLSFGVGAHSCIGRQLAIGVLPKEGARDEERQYGSIPLILHRLFTSGLRPHPEQAPRMDTVSGRPNWASYPVLLGGTA